MCMKELSSTQKMKFLMALQLGHSVKRACEISDTPRRTAYYWRSEDVDFADAWKEAIDCSVEVLEDEVRQRALDREDPKSATMLIFLLKKHRPEYRDNFKTESTVKVSGVKEFDFSTSEVEEAMAILKAV